MTGDRLLELVAAVAIFGLAVWLYRRPAPADERSGGYGSQGAVLLLAVAAIMTIHSLGGLEYRPSTAEINRLSGQ
ncbi:MAG: hypothetical protein ABIO80_04655 [Sphingomicrobium sp.]